MTKIFRNQLFSSGGILVASLMATNFLNFLFNAILGRTLTLEQFSVLTLASTLWLLITIFLNSLASTTTNRTAYLTARRGKNVALGFRGFITKKSFYISLVVAVGWIALLPVFSYLFHIQNYFFFLTLAPAIIFGIFAAVTRGFFGGTFSFVKAAIVIMAESVSKLGIALLLIYLGFANFAYLAIPLSIVVASVVAYILIAHVKTSKSSYAYIFPKKLLFATFLTAFAGVAFLSVDLLLARHFLTATESGVYSLLSLVGKMLYFLGSLLNIFILALASRDTGLNKNSAINFYKILGANIVLLAFGYVFLGGFGRYTVPFLLGSRSEVVLPYLQMYGLAIILFTVAATFSTYHLAKQQFIFAYNGIFCVIVAVVGIILFHTNIFQIVIVLLLASFVYLLLNIILHVMYKDVSEYVDEEDLVPGTRFKNIGNKSLDVSICVPAYNEAKNIRALLKALLSQKTEKINIKKIYVVSSGSTDKTVEYTQRFVDKNPGRIVLIQEDKRRGKASAINEFLKVCKEKVVVIESADTLPLPDTIEMLCRPFLADKNIGMTGGAPIPVNDKSTFLGYVIHTWWWFHRNIPRFGEIIAFRNIIDQVSPRTAVDEAYIQAKFAQMNYKIVHIDAARIYNKGSETVQDMIKQRRRIFNGHTRLQEQEKVHISHMTKSGIKLLVFDYKIYGPTQLLYLIGGIGIEMWANVLGHWDKLLKKNPVKWEIAKSTKNLSKRL